MGEYGYFDEERERILRGLVTADMKMVEAQLGAMNEETRKEYLPAVIVALSNLERATTEAFCALYEINKRGKRNENRTGKQD